MNSINMIILYISLSYIIGSISGSLILGKFWNIDIRKLGSGNAGGTNALRSAGIMFGFLTALIDLTKGIIPAYLASHDISLMLICGGASIIGHVYPIFFNFRGGKGAGTLLGVTIIALPYSVLYVMATLSGELTACSSIQAERSLLIRRRVHPVHTGSHGRFGRDKFLRSTATSATRNGSLGKFFPKAKTSASQGRRRFG